MGVSENSGTPKSSILIGFSIYKPSILGYPYFWKHPYIPTEIPETLRWATSEVESFASLTWVFVPRRFKAKWFPWMSKPLLRWVETTTFWILARLGDSHLIEKKNNGRKTWDFFFLGGDGMMVCSKLVVGWGLWRFNFHFEYLSNFFLNNFGWALRIFPERIPFRIGAIFSDHLEKSGSPWRSTAPLLKVEWNYGSWCVDKNPSTLHGGVNDLMIFNTKAEAEDPIWIFQMDWNHLVLFSNETCVFVGPKVCFLQHS